MKNVDKLLTGNALSWYTQRLEYMTQFVNDKLKGVYDVAPDMAFKYLYVGDRKKKGNYWQTGDIYILVENEKDCLTFKLFTKLTGVDEILDAVVPVIDNMLGIKSLIKGSQVFALEMQGETAGKKLEMSISRLKDCDLKQFVLDYCNGQIVTTQDVPSHLWSCVFMPLALGGLFLTDQEEKDLKDMAPPVNDDRPSLKDIVVPDKPKYIPLPKRPREPKHLVADKKVVENIKRQIKWQQAVDEDIPAYTARIADANKQRNDKYIDKLLKWKASVKQVKDINTNMDLEYAEAVKDYDSQRDSLAERQKEWDVRHEKYQCFYKGFVRERMANIGIFYEYQKEAGPRAVNGYPCFFSMRILHVDDWKKAEDFIKTELQRRKDFVGGSV